MNIQINNSYKILSEQITGFEKKKPVINYENAAAGTKLLNYHCLQAFFDNTFEKSKLPSP